MIRNPDHEYDDQRDAGRFDDLPSQKVCDEFNIERINEAIRRTNELLRVPVISA